MVGMAIFRMASLNQLQTLSGIETIGSALDTGITEESQPTPNPLRD